MSRYDLCVQRTQALLPQGQLHLAEGDKIQSVQSMCTQVVHNYGYMVCFGYNCGLNIVRLQVRSTMYGWLIDVQ